MPAKALFLREEIIPECGSGDPFDKDGEMARKRHKLEEIS